LSLCFPFDSLPTHAVDNASYDFFLDELMKIQIEEEASKDTTLMGPREAAALDRSKTIHVVLITGVSVAQVWSAKNDYWWWLPFLVRKTSLSRFRSAIETTVVCQDLGHGPAAGNVVKRTTVRLTVLDYHARCGV